MSSNFREKRCIEFSLIDYITTNVDTDWTGITVVKSFSQAYKGTLPVICVRSLNAYHNQKEVGNTAIYNDVTIVIDIFATSDGNRLDLADYLIDKLRQGCVYYDYSKDSSDPEALDKEADGRLRVIRWINDTRIDFGVDGNNYDKFRHNLSFSVRKS